MSEIEKELEIEKPIITAVDTINISDYPLIEVINYLKFNQKDDVYDVTATKIALNKIQNDTHISYIFDKNNLKSIKELSIANSREKYPWLFFVGEDTNIDLHMDTLENLDKRCGSRGYRFRKVKFIRFFSNTAICIKYE